MWNKVTETKCNIFGWVWLQNMESKQMQTCSIIWNYPSYKAGVFLCNISPRTKHNWHCTIGFLILFFREEYILFSNVYVSVNTIFECHPLSTCATEGMEGGHPKCVQVHPGGKGITPHVYLRTYRQLLFSCFCLKVSCPSVVI